MNASFIPLTDAALGFLAGLIQSICINQQIEWLDWRDSIHSWNLVWLILQIRLIKQTARNGKDNPQSTLRNKNEYNWTSR